MAEKVIPAVDLARLDALHRKMAGRVRYLLGAKAASLYADSSTIERIDCSGYVRYVLARCGGPILPDGSQIQLAWCRANLRRLARYSDVHFAAADPSRLFIAVMSPAPGAEWPRHVWLVRAGATLESCSSLGVGSRPWDHRALKGAQACFELPAA